MSIHQKNTEKDIRLKDIQNRLNKGEKTTFAERQILIIHQKKHPPKQKPIPIIKEIGPHKFKLEINWK